MENEQFTTKIDNIFDQGRQKSPDFDTQFVLDGYKKFFDHYCAEGEDLDPRPTNTNNNGKSPLASRLYSLAANKFVALGRNFAAEDLLLHGWDKFSTIQEQEGCKIYKGLMALWLSYLYLNTLGDIGAATRWALLTHADDALVGHTTGMGMTLLRYHFGMSNQALEDFNAITRENRLNQRIENWSQSNRFADDMLVKFALKYPQYAHLFANPTSVLEFPPCIPYLSALWKEVNEPRSHRETTLTGNKLEYMAAYLFLLIPGFIPRSKVKPESRDFENDLVVSNFRSSGNIEAELFGRNFLVECKNQKDAASVDQVGYFLYRMRLTHTKFGVLFAKNGITGTTDEDAAQNLRQRAFHEDDALCVVIERTDIDRILKKDTTFRSLLLEKTNELRFGKQQHT